MEHAMYIHAINHPAQFVVSNILQCDLCYCNCCDPEYNNYNYNYIMAKSITSFHPSYVKATTLCIKFLVYSNFKI